VELTTLKDSKQEVVMGDIIVSVETCVNRNNSNNAAITDVIEVSVHGLLHLFGYDHLGKMKKEWSQKEKFVKDIIEKYI